MKNFQLKRFLVLIYCEIFINAPIYLCFSVVSASFDVFSWNIITRALYSFISIIFFFIVLAAYNDMIKEIKEGGEE